MALYSNQNATLLINSRSVGNSTSESEKLLAQLKGNLGKQEIHPGREIKKEERRKGGRVGEREGEKNKQVDAEAFFQLTGSTN